MLAFHPWQMTTKFLLLLQTFHCYLKLNAVTGQQMTLIPFKYDISQKYPENFEFQDKALYPDNRKRRAESNLDTLRNRILDNKELSWKLSTNKFQRETKTPDPRKMMAIDVSSLNRNGIKMGRGGGGGNSGKHSSRLPSLMDVDVSILSRGPDARFPLSHSVSHMMEPLRSPHDRLPTAINEPPIASSRPVVPRLNNEQNDIVVFPLFQLPFKAMNFYHTLLGEGKKGSKNSRQEKQTDYTPFVYMPASRRNIPKMLADMTSHRIVMLQPENSRRLSQKSFDEDQAIGESSEELLQ